MVYLFDLLVSYESFSSFFFFKKEYRKRNVKETISKVGFSMSSLSLHVFCIIFYNVDIKIYL